MLQALRFTNNWIHISAAVKAFLGPCIDAITCLAPVAGVGHMFVFVLMYFLLGQNRFQVAISADAYPDLSCRLVLFARVFALLWFASYTICDLN